MYLFYDHPINPAQAPALRFVRSGPGKRLIDILHTGKSKGDDLRRNKTLVVSEPAYGGAVSHQANVSSRVALY